MNWTVDNNGAWDYAADTRGYTVGGMAEYDDRTWSLRYGIFAMPTVANGIDMDWAFSRAHGQNGEFELRHSFVREAQRASRASSSMPTAPTWAPIARRSKDFLNGSDTATYGVTVPTITLHEHFGALKYGFGYNTEQELTANLRVFGRFGWNEGQHESFAYTEVDQTVQAGARLRRNPLASPGGQDRPGRRLQRHQARPSELSEATAVSAFCSATAISTTAAKISSRATTTGTPGAGMFYAVDVQHIGESRLQPRPRPRLGWLGPRPRGLLEPLPLARHVNPPIETTTIATFPRSEAACGTI